MNDLWAHSMLNMPIMSKGWHTNCRCQWDTWSKPHARVEWSRDFERSSLRRTQTNL